MAVMGVRRRTNGEPGKEHGEAEQDGDHLTRKGVLVVQVSQQIHLDGLRVALTHDLDLHSLAKRM